MCPQRLSYGGKTPSEHDEHGHDERPDSENGGLLGSERLPALNADADPDRCAQMFKALSNPHRLRIFMRLAGALNDSGPAEYPVGELGEDLNIARSTLSHHLRELNAASLIRTRRDGRVILCKADKSSLAELASIFIA